MAIAEGDEGSNDESEETDTEPESSEGAPTGETKLIETLEDESAPVDEDLSEIQFEEEDRSF